MLENVFLCRLSIFIFIVCDFYIGGVRSTINTNQFFVKSSLKDKICIESERITQIFTRSKTECTLLCGERSACTGVFFNPATRSCTACREYTSAEDHIGTIFFSKLSTLNLEGGKFKIVAKENNQFWHYNGAGRSLVVSSLAQPNDNYVKFLFEKQADGSLKIKSVATGAFIYDGYSVAGARLQYLNGYGGTDDDHMRYLVTMESQGYYRIQTKATGRYVRLDSDQYVSSRENIKDDRSLFELVEV